MTHRKQQLIVLIIVLALSLMAVTSLAQEDTTPVYSVRGEYAVGTQDFQIDAETPVDITVWYPADNTDGAEEVIDYNYEIKMDMPPGMVASVAGQAISGAPFALSDGPYPLVVLSPGFAIGRSSYAWLAEHLTSYGFVVVAPEHHESADESLSGFAPAAISRPQEIHTLLTYLDAQVQAGGTLEGLIDTETVAVIGHSYGGYTSLMMGGARYDIDALNTLCDEAVQAEDPNAWLCGLVQASVPQLAELAGLDELPEGLWPSWGDDRVDAIVPMAGDAYFFGEAGLAEITVPIMAIGGTADTGTPFAWGTEPTFNNVASENKVRVAFEGAEHMIFAATCDALPFFAEIGFESFCSDAVWDVDHAHALVSHFVTAFLLSELQQDTAAAAALSPEAVNFADIDYTAQGY